MEEIVYLSYDGEDEEFQEELDDKYYSYDEYTTEMNEDEELEPE